MARLREDYKEYPKADDMRSGCKVGWRYYRDKDLANECSHAAEHNARIDRGLGYGHGFCAPGSVTWDEKRGMYEVCIP